MKKDFAIWITLCVIVGLSTILYLSVSLGINEDNLIMPLDDTYIHFQYARQMATGHPFAYNTGDSPTSGSTSLIYTPLLAIGYVLGFHDLALAYWAIAHGAISLLGSAWIIYQSVRASGGSILLSSTVMLTFVLNGAFIWSALSGMETLLFTFTVLLCLYAYQQQWQGKAAFAGVLVALIRPEGAFIAGSLAVAIAWRHWRTERKFLWWSMLPVLACGVQPLVNLTVTGSFSATGNQAKSEFYDPQSPFTEQLQRVLDHWVRMWREFFEGHAKYGDAYIPGAIFVMATLMLLWSIRHSAQKRTIHPALLAGFWMVGLSAAVASLETAFWHYKRYQLPIMALAVPLAGWLLAAAAQRFGYKRLWAGLAGVIMLFSVATNLEFLRLYYNNVAVTSHMQYQLAQWINANLPQDARIAVFDVGITRYVGKRYTYDIVGLTTPDIASARRQGPGAVLDTMAAHPQRPDYFALYPVANHPTTIYLMNTSVWSEELAIFEAPELDNTTSAGSIQIVAKADWSSVEIAAQPIQRQPQFDRDNYRLLGTLDIGDITSEQAFNYTWQNDASISGYLTTIEQLPYYGDAEGATNATDGVRGINSEEQFDLPATNNGDDYLVVMRVDARQEAILTVGCDDPLATLTVPPIAGSWVNVEFLVPGSIDHLCIRTQETYYPARYWVYSGTTTATPRSETAIIAWPGVELLDYTVSQSESTLTLHTTWAVPSDHAAQALAAGLQGNSKIFVHLYESGNADQPPVSQWDGYLQTSTPLSNLLPGVFEHTITLPLSAIAPGTYEIGIGAYDQSTGERYSITTTDREIIGQRAILEPISIPASD